MSRRGNIASLAIWVAVFYFSLQLNPLASAQTSSDRLTLGYTKPATVCMNEALPVGNGRLGAMIYGIPAAERLILNEDSLWTGDADPSGDYNRMGAYQMLGELRIALPGHEAAVNYRPDLNLAHATAHVTGLCARRGFVVEMSWKAGKLQNAVIRCTAGQPCRLRGGGSAKITPQGKPVDVKSDGDSLAFSTTAGASYDINY